MLRPAFVDALLSAPRSLVFEEPRRSIVATVSCSLTPPGDAAAVEAALSHLGLVDDDLRAFYACCDGGDLVQLAPSDPEGRGVFLPSIRLYAAQDLERQTDCFRAGFEFVSEEDRPPSYPGVAIGEATETGNYFVAVPDGSSVSVYFFDHDDPTMNATPLAYSFRAFVTLLATPPFMPLARVSGFQSVRVAP